MAGLGQAGELTHPPAIVMPGGRSAGMPKVHVHPGACPTRPLQACTSGSGWSDSHTRP